MSGRPCACGCPERLDPGASSRTLYVNERHRKRAYRKRVARAAEAAGVPASLSLERIQASTDTGERIGDAQRGGGRARGPLRRRRRGPLKGVRVYFRDPAQARALLELRELATTEDEAAAFEAIQTALKNRDRRADSQ